MNMNFVPHILGNDYFFSIHTHKKIWQEEGQIYTYPGIGNL